MEKARSRGAGMQPARQTGARATFFTVANFTLRERRRKVNEGSYLLSCWQRRPRVTTGSTSKLLVAHRLRVASGAQFWEACNAQNHLLTCGCKEREELDRANDAHRWIGRRGVTGARQLC